VVGAGVVAIRPQVADVAIEKNKLTRLSAMVERGTLKDGDLVADITGGTITAAMDGEALNAKASLALASLTYGERTARGVDLSAEGRGVEWQENADGYKFLLDDAVLTIGTGKADAPEFSASRTNARVALQAVEGNWAGEQLRLGFALASPRLAQRA
jgi:hypothetical protein